MKVKKFLSTVCFLGLMSAANAVPVFTETFDSPLFVGPAILSFGNPDASSDRWANTNYYTINSGVNGWTFGADTYVAKETDTSGVLSGNGALLLNETGG